MNYRIQSYPYPFITTQPGGTAIDWGKTGNPDNVPHLANNITCRTNCVFKPNNGNWSIVLPGTQFLTVPDDYQTKLFKVRNVGYQTLGFPTKSIQRAVKQGFPAIFGILIEVDGDVQFLRNQYSSIGSRIGLEIPILSDAVRSALDFVTSVFDRVPGSDWIKRAVENGATWLADMARDPKGYFILSVISANLYGVVANLGIPGAVGQTVIGPVTASIVYALPGVIAGDPFIESYIYAIMYWLSIFWTSNFTNRANITELYCQQYFLSDMLAPLQADYEKGGYQIDFYNQILRLKQNNSTEQFREVLIKNKLTPYDIFQKYNSIYRNQPLALHRILIQPECHPGRLKLDLREDLIAININIFFKQNIYDILKEFDPVTGKFIGVEASGFRPGPYTIPPIAVPRVPGPYEIPPIAVPMTPGPILAPTGPATRRNIPVMKG
jgi:hypothetical protein